MPRQIPRYQLHKATGQAKVRLDGKDHYLGRWGTPESKRRYDQVIADWLAGRASTQIPQRFHADSTGVTRGPALTVADILDRYLIHAESYYRKRGKTTAQVDRIERAVKVVLARFGNLAAVAFGPRSLKEVRRDMVRKGWTRGFVNGCVGCLVRAWGWAVSEELVPGEAAHALREVQPLREGEEGVREGRTIAPVSWEVVEATLKHLRPAVADLLRVQYLGGMRPVEACHLAARYLDRVSQPGLWVYAVPREANKNAHRGKPRVAFLGPKAQAVLLPYLERCGPDDYLFSPARSRQAFDAERHANRTTVNYPSCERQRHARRKVNPKWKPGQRYTTRALQTAIRRACKLAGVPHWSPNQLRHARGTELRAMADLGTAGAVLGHVRLETTLHYAEESLAKAAEAMRRVG